MANDPKEIDFEFFQQDALFSYEEELLAQEYDDLALESAIDMGDEDV